MEGSDNGGREELRSISASLSNSLASLSRSSRMAVSGGESCGSSFNPSFGESGMVMVWSNSNEEYQLGGRTGFRFEMRKKVRIVCDMFGVDR
jgi:hypothetical protein